MALWASDGNGHGAVSNTFNVVARPFTVSLPANVTEGQSPATGTISVPVGARPPIWPWTSLAATPTA